MQLDEAKEILKNAGYLLEDTDDYDDADLGINTKSKRYTSFDKRMRDKHRNHNYYDYETSLDSKTYDARYIKGPATKIKGFDKIDDYNWNELMGIQYICSAIYQHIKSGELITKGNEKNSPQYGLVNLETNDGYKISLKMKGGLWDYNKKQVKEKSNITLTIEAPDGNYIEKTWEPVEFMGRHPTWFKTFKVMQDNIPELEDCRLTWLDEAKQILKNAGFLIESTDINV